MTWPLWVRLVVSAGLLLIATGAGLALRSTINRKR